MRKSNTKRKARGTPWDIVNVFGYAIGMPRAVLDYDARTTSKYDVKYCSTRPILHAMRDACSLRMNIIREYDRLSSTRYWQDAPKVDKYFRRRVAGVLGEGIVDLKVPAYTLLTSVQQIIESRLYHFEQELPEWCTLGTEILQQFRLPFGFPDETGQYCKQYVHQLETCGHGALLLEGGALSSRVMRDDRDLCEELCALYGRNLSEIKFPFKRTQSNRRSHLCRLEKFCKEHGPVVVEVDTENVEASTAIAFFKCVEKELPGALAKINLYLSGMEGRTWRHLSEFIQTEVCIKEVARIREHKSSMDTAVIASVIEDKYRGNVNGVLLVSSDCDFLVLHEQVPGLPICYCCVRKQAASATLSYLKDNKLPTVYLDYIVNNVMADEVADFCVRTHVAVTVTSALPNVRDLVTPAIEAVCPNSQAGRYTHSVGSLLSELKLSITADGAIVASVS